MQTFGYAWSDERSGDVHYTLTRSTPYTRDYSLLGRLVAATDNKSPVAYAVHRPGETLAVIALSYIEADDVQRKMSNYAGNFLQYNITPLMIEPRHEPK